MTHIKLFEEFNNSELTTLRDVINPDHFEEEEDREMYIETVLKTCTMLGVELPPDVARLHELGLTNQQDLLDNLPLDSVVEVFNLVGLTHLTEQSVRQFCYRFPGILAYDADLDEYRRPESSREIEEWYAEHGDVMLEIRVVLFEDTHGLRAVEWESQQNLSYYMLRRDFESAK